MKERDMPSSRDDRATRRRERLEAALRANLARRKEQARVRRSHDATAEPSEPAGHERDVDSG